MSEDNDQYYFNFSFFKVDPKWRWMADLAKEESAKEVENIIKNSGIMFRSYSNLGLRDDTDFLFWFAAKTVEEIQAVIEKLYKTVFGKYIIPSHVIIYPFTKTREWYLLPKEKRQQIMDEHIEVSKKYPQIVLNTTYSFGIHDEDFLLAFEVDDIRDFQDLIMDLRETRVSAYVKNDIPMIVCVKKDIIPLIISMG